MLYLTKTRHQIKCERTISNRYYLIISVCKCCIQPRYQKKCKMIESNNENTISLVFSILSNDARYTTACLTTSSYKDSPL